MKTILALLVVASILGGCAADSGTSPTGTSSPSAETPTATSFPGSPSPFPTVSPTSPTDPTAPVLTSTVTPAAPTSTPTSTLPTSTPTTPSENALTLTLGVGETGSAGDGWVVHFEGVENDSRCGVDVVCVWAGEATVILVATSPEGEDFRARIVVSPAEGTGSAGELTLHVLELAPEPRADRPIDPADYLVTVEVTRG